MRGFISRTSSFLLATGLLLPPAFADVVVLEGGETIEGIVREDGDQVVIELDVGTISLDRASVKEIRKSKTKLDELRARREKVAFNDVTGLYELALWANREGLVTQAHAIAREILKLDDDHLGARMMLGYQKHEGRWLTEPEVMAATGHVRYDGTWMKAEEAKRLEEEKRTRAEARAKEARLQAMERMVVAAEEKATLAREEAERARQEAEEAKQSRWFIAGGNGYWPYNPYPRVYPNVYPTITPQPSPTKPAAPTPATPPRRSGGGRTRSR